MRAIAAFLQQNGLPERVELLPYHALGESKAQALGREPRRFAAPEKAHIEHLKTLLPCT